MRGQEFKVRDKKVQKMTRDGLTEKNLTQGTQQRISTRLEEISFRQERQADTSAGHRSQGRIQTAEQKQGHNPAYQPPENPPVPHKRPLLGGRRAGNMGADKCPCFHAGSRRCSDLPGAVFFG